MTPDGERGEPQSPDSANGADERPFNLAERIYDDPPRRKRGGVEAPREGYNLAKRVFANDERAAVSVLDPPNSEVPFTDSAGVEGRAVATTADSAAIPPRRRFSLRTFESLGHVGYRYYLLSMLGQMASLNMQQLVRGFLVFELTGSYAALGTIYLVNSVPGIALSAAGGVLADRVRRKKNVVQIGQLLNATNALVVGLLVWTGAITFEYLLIAAIAHGTVMSLMMPARQAMLPEVVGFDRLMNAVALNSAGMNATRLLGPAAAGFLVAALGPHTVYFIITGLYLYASALLTRVTTEYAVEPGPTAQRESGLRDLIDGLRYMWSDQRMRVVLVFSTVFAMLAMPYQFLLPGFVAGVLHEGPDKLGLLMSFAGIGALIGSLIVATIPPKGRGLLLIGSALWMSISLIAFSASTWIVGTAAIMLVIGVGDAGRMSLGMVLVQSYTRDEFRGRVMSLFMMQRSFATFFTFFVGVAASLFGAPLALGALAAVLGVLALTILARPGLLRSLD